MKLGIEGHHALVTGGSRGIGKSIVEALLREGCNVSYCARTVSGTEFEGFSEREPGVETQATASGTALDICKTEQIKGWVDAAAAKHGRLDIVISNASPSAGSSPEGWTTRFHADLMACVTLIDAATDHLERSPSSSPSIIISSSSAQREWAVFPGSNGKSGPYAPFKAALAQHANNMAHILGPKGIRVNVLAPGLIKFPGSVWDRACKNCPDEVGPWIDRVKLAPERRWGTPEEVADVAVYLASPRASYVSGTSVLITGAFHHATQY